MKTKTDLDFDPRILCKDENESRFWSPNIQRGKNEFWFRLPTLYEAQNESRFRLPTPYEAKNEFRFRLLCMLDGQNESRFRLSTPYEAKNELRFCFIHTLKGQNESWFCFIRTSGSLFEISITLPKHPEKADQKPFLTASTSDDMEQELLYLFTEIRWFAEVGTDPLQRHSAKLHRHF